LRPATSFAARVLDMAPDAFAKVCVPGGGHTPEESHLEDHLGSPTRCADGGAASRAGAAASTSGALSARNRPVKVSSDGSPGSGSAGSPPRRYGGVDRIFPVHRHDVPAEIPAARCEIVRPAWVRATGRGEIGGYSFRSQGTGCSVRAARAAGGRLTRLDRARRPTRLAPVARMTSTRRAPPSVAPVMLTCRTPSA
jgi:hypothetical protein